MNASSLPLETELLQWPRNNRNSAIVARHYGLDGNGGLNYKRIGDELGLTRERVRQIVSAGCQEVLKTGGPAVLEQIISVIASSLPAPAASLEARLRAENLTLKTFRLEGIIQIAGLLDRPVPFAVADLKGERFVVDTECRPFRDIVDRARQNVRRYGMANVAECLSQEPKTGIGKRELKLAGAVLSAQRGFQWLNQRSGWFWFSAPPANRVASRIRKMLAVTHTLSIDEVRAGFARTGDSLAPNQILLEFCRRLPGLSVEGETIAAKTRIGVGEVLNKTERDIFRLLSDHDGCMSNSELISCSRVLGIKRPTYYQCITSSPIISRPNSGHYGLIGRSQMAVNAVTP